MKFPTRSKEEIIAELIKVALSPVKQTRIMYKANMSYSQMKYYLQFLQEKEMLVNDGEGQWLATAKGREYLRLFNQFQEVIGPENKDVSPLLARKTNHLC